MNTYRNLGPALAMRLEALEASPLDVSALRSVYERRVARAVAGAVATTLGVLLFAAAVVSLIESRGKPTAGGSGDDAGSKTLLLLGAWPVALGAYVIARVWAQWRSGELARPLAPSGDPAADLARLESASPARVLASHARRIERVSVAMPLIGMAALLPLTIHYLVWCAICGANGTEVSASRFDEWIAYSVMLVGHAHLVVAFFAYRFARKLPAMPTAALRAQSCGWGSAYCFAVLAACIPGAALYLIPPILVAVTGLPTIPAIFLGMRGRVVRERDVLALAA